MVYLLYYGMTISLATRKIEIVLSLRYGGRLVHDQKLTGGLLASFLMYMLQVAIAFGMLASIFGGKLICRIVRKDIHCSLYYSFRFYAGRWR